MSANIKYKCSLRDIFILTPLLDFFLDLLLLNLVNKLIYVQQFKTIHTENFINKALEGRLTPQNHITITFATTIKFTHAFTIH